MQVCKQSPKHALSKFFLTRLPALNLLVLSREQGRPFQGAPGASRGFQGPPRARGLQNFKRCFEREMRPAVECQSLEPWARLKCHAGWSGWTRPPTMAGGGGGGDVARLAASVKGSRGGF